MNFTCYLIKISIKFTCFPYIYIFAKILTADILFFNAVRTNKIKKNINKSFDTPCISINKYCLEIHTNPMQKCRADANNAVTNTKIA